jgi:hypothetical protein
LNVAAIVTLVGVLTPVVATVKFVEIFPAGIVTELGTVVEGSLLVRAMTVPPGAAGPLIVTVPIEDAPPATEFGFRARETRTGGLIVRAAD